MFLFALFHAIKLPHFERKKEVKGDEKRETIWDTFGRAFSSYLKQESIALVLAFIICYKLRDEILISMTTPFLKRALDINNEQYVWVGGMLWAAGIVLGGVGGGWLIERGGLKVGSWRMT